MLANISLAEELESRCLLSSASVSGGVLHVVGDLKTANVIVVRRDSNNQIVANINGHEQSFSVCDVINKVIIDGGNKADKLEINETDAALGVPVLMNGKIGDDTLIGGSEDDTLRGGVDDDSIDGNGGNDMLLGQNGEDAVHGGDGNDIIVGGNGDLQ